MVGTSTWCDSRRLCRDPDFLAGAPADSPIYTEVNNSSSRRFFTGLGRKRSFLRSFQVYLARQGWRTDSRVWSLLLQELVQQTFFKLCDDSK
jgi:hypothetical protein